MKIEAACDKAILRPDFAHRVIGRVHRARRRRRVYRWTLISACALAVIAVLSLQPRSRLLSNLANRNDGQAERSVLTIEPGGSPQYDLPPLGQPLAFFFPGASAVADFQSSQATYWHAYDPWWNPNS